MRNIHLIFRRVFRSSGPSGQYGIPKSFVLCHPAWFSSNRQIFKWTHLYVQTNSTRHSSTRSTSTWREKRKKLLGTWERDVRRRATADGNWLGDAKANEAQPCGIDAWGEENRQGWHCRWFARCQSSYSCPRVKAPLLHSPHVNLLLSL